MCAYLDKVSGIKISQYCTSEAEDRGPDSRRTVTSSIFYTLRPRQNGHYFCSQYFQVHFLQWISSYLYPRPTKLEGGYTGFTLSVCPSVRPSVCLLTAWFPEHKSSLLWNFNFKFHMHVDGGHRQKPIDFQRCHFQNGCLAAILDFLVSGL